ncbi:MAG TPA: hypothetical protein VL550_03550 [Rhodocyclaceae bacterium]|nr:hypothetical protein [Rhodocyclaceae bacterium]
MLGLFAEKSDHPLADPKEAKRLFAGLTIKNASEALDEAAILIESLHRDQRIPPDKRWDILRQMDEVMIGHARRFARDYAAATASSRSGEMRLWRLGAEYWRYLADGYLDVFEATLARPRDSGIKTTMPNFYVRTLHAFAAILKWGQFRYAPPGREYWADLGKIYMAAVDANAAGMTVPLYVGDRTTTPEREYLKVLVFHASSMDSLLPQEVELADRLLDYLLPQFQFGAQVQPDSVYWVDALSKQAPMRFAVRPQASPSLRCFSPGLALDAVATLKSQVEQETLPSALALGNSYTPAMMIDVLNHLADYWAPIPPQRSHARHRVKSRMTVLQSLPTAYRRLATLVEGDVESWEVEDVSQGGMRATASLARDSKLAVGTLLLLRPEGGENWLLGVVRRFARHDDTNPYASLGIETLSRQPRALCVDSGGIRTEVILVDDWQTAAQVRVVLPAAAWEDNIAMTFDDGGTSVKLFPDGQEQSGPDYLIGRYRVRVAASDV